MYIIKLFYLLLAFQILWTVLQAWRHARRTETTQPLKAFLLLLIYFASYLVFPLILLSIFEWYWGLISLIQILSHLVLATLFIYARFIEPHSVVVKQHQFQLNPLTPLQNPLKIALIADLHIGLYSGSEQQLKKIVAKIKQQQPDFVVVAGDWTYEPENTLLTELAVLQEITCPIYSVNGNHDEQYPGPPIQKLLQQALEANRIIDIENKIIEFDEIRLFGVGDLWAGKTDMRHLPDYPQDKPWLLLSHNPDTVEMVPQLPIKPLMLSGHTHGGQIELPWITSYVLKKVSILGHKRGYYQHKHANVFVTVGTGMVGAPFRFRVPPTVDIITLL